MVGPTHDPNTCTRKGERWECLHAIDADHFWLGDLMVDLNQIYYEANRLDSSLSDAQEHSMRFSLANLCHACGCVNTGDMRFMSAGWVVKVLKKLNELGLHTGYRESPTERER